jgi:hypothetical protein
VITGSFNCNLTSLLRGISANVFTASKIQNENNSYFSSDIFYLYFLCLETYVL